MTTSTTYPSGQTLVSSALTLDQMNKIIQPLTSGMIGVNPPDYKQVRVDYPPQGQPFVTSPSVDVCFIACVPKDTQYSRVRDFAYSGAGPVTETWGYTRAWDVSWTFYGPSSVDRARQVRSALFMEYFSDALSDVNLYPVPDAPEPTRTPENFNAQWWERTDYHIEMYEQVTETITYGAATSVEIKLYDGAPDDPVADFTVGA